MPGELIIESRGPRVVRRTLSAGVFEYEVNADGTTTSKIWEWK